MTHRAYLGFLWNPLIAQLHRITALQFRLTLNVLFTSDALNTNTSYHQAYSTCYLLIWISLSICNRSCFMTKGFHFGCRAFVNNLNWRCSLNAVGPRNIIMYPSKGPKKNHVFFIHHARLQYEPDCAKYIKEVNIYLLAKGSVNFCWQVIAEIAKCIGHFLCEGITINLENKTNAGRGKTFSFLCLENMIKRKHRKKKNSEETGR